MKFNRALERPKKSFLLLGPRGTGKSTWLRSLSFEVCIDLLSTRERLMYLRDASLLASTIAHVKAGEWVLIDEVQKVPDLLDEVHALYESRKINFALSGSSARKLRKSGTNLLAGRAINRRMYPLVYPEYQDSIRDLNDLIDWGTLPLVLDNWDHKEDTLATYIDNYLRQELLEEGFVRNLEPFARFLAVAGQLNGQILNVENIARESKVKRPTVDKYFQILIDTLIGYRLPAYQPTIRINESAHPKFYLFDAGVARAAAGFTHERLDQGFRGFLFETYLLNEVRAYNEYRGRHRDLFYYSVRSSGDVDLIIQLEKKSASKPDKVIAVEFKLGTSWRSDWAKSLLILNEDHSKSAVERMIIVYTGDKRAKHGPVELLPAFEFLTDLYDGRIF
jgi:predicted AAA+ superfamily ATPase